MEHSSTFALVTLDRSVIVRKNHFIVATYFAQISLASAYVTVTNVLVEDMVHLVEEVHDIAVLNRYQIGHTVHQCRMNQVPAIAYTKYSY